LQDLEICWSLGAHGKTKDQTSTNFFGNSFKKGMEILPEFARSGRGGCWPKRQMP